MSDPVSRSFFDGYYPKARRWLRGRRWWWWALIGLGFTLLLPLAFVLSVAWGAWGPLPDRAELANIQHHTASELYSADGALLGKYFIENRTQVDFEDIAPVLVDALVATEDARFYEHSGVDTRSLMRVAFKSVLLRDESSGGGSTLSQQLAKNLYPRARRAWWYLPVAKVREMLIARRLESVYSKEELLTLYLNTVPFGESVFGIGAATERFFSCAPAELRPEEAAVLVGMLKATTAYNPRRNPERSQARRNVVLDQMVVNGYLESATADSLKALPLSLRYRNVTRSDGPAPYFRQEIAQEIQSWLDAHPAEDGHTYNLYTDGLRIHTTLDSRLQGYAEAAVSKHMASLQKDFFQHWEGRKLWDLNDPGLVRAYQQSPRYRSLKAAGKTEAEILEIFQQPRAMRVWSWEGEVEKEMSPMDSLMYYLSFLQAGFLAMEPGTGYVRAWVGGINYQHFQYDHVTAQRQVGSTFKPIVYAAALEGGMDPCQYFPNEQTVYTDYEDWSPGNADGKYGGYYSLRGGLTHSVNTISAAVIMSIGVDQAVTFARRFGFTHELPQSPSLVLGTADLTLKEMVGAYSAFANRGERTLPVYLTRIEDRQGQVIVEFPVAPERVRVMPDYVADMMADMLQSVVDSGTASRLRRVYKLPGELGGKTGTTQNQTDGWFIGINPKLVAGAWVGGADRKVRFRSLRLGQGANTALPIYGLFMQQVMGDRRYRDIRQASFQDPGASSLMAMDCPAFT
ncbi:MAG: penicillin-binding protein, partial [Bacteroidetes bacterium]